MTRPPFAWQAGAALALALVPFALLFPAWRGSDAALAAMAVSVACGIPLALWGAVRARKTEMRGLEICQAALLVGGFWVVVIAGVWLALRALPGDGI